ncbi:flagellar hook-basal body complex protein FliE [Ensifer soli]|uniref:flagellar hook-basal body complex protein FliE n=1 Tax=Ciceribacter sp. sgz301302 TaxID=3342379 RepID=UPI0035BA5645
MIDPIQTIGALSKMSATEGVTGGSAAGQASAQMMQGVAQPQSFASLMSDMAGGVVDNLKQAETLSIQGIRGEANTREVVDAVMQAEQSLQTAMSIRDKLVTAYLEIARMQI